MWTLLIVLKFLPPCRGKELKRRCKSEYRRARSARYSYWIMVNGQVTFENSKETGVYPGKLLRCS